jgi:transposase
VVVRLGDAQPAGASEGSRRHAETPFRQHHPYLKHRITNATSESINAKIQWVKYTARGFRNKQNFINAIYFHSGGLDLAPAATK